MTNILLMRLSLRNFKGIDEFEFNSDGKNTTVYGANASGKTTIVDAFYWLLFGKDSQNRTDFQIKKLNPDGTVAQHMLEHEVEGVLQIDGIERTFRRVFAEKWTKKRGSAKKEFTGHETTYYVDQVPVKEAAYKAEVARIIREDMFRLITNPVHFNEQLKTEQRRALLLEICGDVTDQDVIDNNEELKELPGYLNGRTIEQHQSIIDGQKRNLNKEIEKIPIRIDEVRRSMPDISQIDVDMIDTEISNLRDQIAEQENQLQQIRSGSAAIDIQNNIRHLEGELLEITNRLKAGSVDLIAAQRKVLADHQWEYDQLTQQLNQKRSQCQNNQRRIDAGKATAQTLRSRWAEVKAATFEHKHESEGSCLTCGQALPEDQLQEAFEKAQAAFNKQRAQTLETIQVEGKASMKEVNELEASNQTLLAEIESLTQQQSEKQAGIIFAKTELADLDDAMIDPKEDADYQAVQQQIVALQNQLTDIRTLEQESTANTQQMIASLRTEAAQLEQQRAKVTQANAVTARIAELEQQEARLAEEYEQLEYQVFLIEAFIRTKVSMLEGRINSKFKYARFKLFDQQINGGLKEVCETTYRGVPYGSGLNHAARINVGLDIVNTLSVHCGVTAPIFFDNAESVTKLIDTNSQMIPLIVSKDDATLRIENMEGVHA